MSRNSGSASLRFTVSGPDVDKSYASEGVATSAAITFAGRSKVATNYYVRDLDGKCVARVETDGKGRVKVWTVRVTPKAVA